MKRRRTGPVRPRTTGQVAKALGMSEPELNARIRGRADVTPPLVGGKRCWRAQDIAALRRLLRARQAG